MFQIRIHGRGGQGVVSAAEMMSVAAFIEGRHAQAFPSFGSERMGAPVMAFCRIDDKEIRLREPVLEPDALIIQDPTLLHQVDQPLRASVTTAASAPPRQRSSPRVANRTWENIFVSGCRDFDGKAGSQHLPCRPQVAGTQGGWTRRSGAGRRPRTRLGPTARIVTADGGNRSFRAAS